MIFKMWAKYTKCSTLDSNALFEVTMKTLLSKVTNTLQAHHTTQLNT